MSYLKEGAMIGLVTSAIGGGLGVSAAYFKSLDENLKAHPVPLENGEVVDSMWEVFAADPVGGAIVMLAVGTANVTAFGLGGAAVGGMLGGVGDLLFRKNRN